jgi:hypothetical protein
MKELEKNELMVIDGGGFTDWLIEKVVEIVAIELYDYVASGEYTKFLASNPGAADAMMMSLH